MQLTSVLHGIIKSLNCFHNIYSHQPENLTQNHLQHHHHNQEDFEDHLLHPTKEIVHKRIYNRVKKKNQCSKFAVNYPKII